MVLILPNKQNESIIIILQENASDSMLNPKYVPNQKIERSMPFEKIHLTPNMQGQTEITDKLVSSSYAIDIRYPELFLIFFRPLMEKYLASSNNQIYISSSNKFVSLYMEHYTNNPCIHHVNNDLVPHIPNDGNNIYIYHQQGVLTHEKQMDLLRYLKTRKAIRYIFVGRVYRLLPYVVYNLFSYYIKSIRNYDTDIIIKRDYKRRLFRRYLNQTQKKRWATKPLIIYDYYIFHDLQHNTSCTKKFNKKIFVPKNIKTINAVAPANPSVDVKPAIMNNLSIIEI